MQYNPAIQQRFRSPQFVGQLDALQLNVYSAQVGSIAEGSAVQFQLQIDEASGIITACRFKAYGCGATIAAAEYLCEATLGQTLEQAQTVNSAQIQAALALPPAKLHCAILVVQALRDVLALYSQAA